MTSKCNYQACDHFPFVLCTSYFIYGSAVLCMQLTGILQDMGVICNCRICKGDQVCEREHAYHLGGELFLLFLSQ